MRAALFRAHRTHGAISTLWGLAFALFLWAGLRSVGIGQSRAVAFAVVAGAAITLFVYLRGAGREAPPIDRPGAFLRRRLRRARARSVAPRPETAEPRELVRARVALADRDFAAAADWLREAERVAVAQRKLDELLEARRLVRIVGARAFGHPKEAAGRLAETIEEHVHEFPPGELEAAGIEARPDPLAVVLGRRRPDIRTADVAPARAALDEGDLREALRVLREASSVAIAQRKLDELLEARDLVRTVASRAEGRTHAAAERLAARVDDGLRTFAGGY